MTLRDLLYRIRGDATGFRAAAGDAERSADRVTGAVHGIQDAWRQAGIELLAVIGFFEGIERSVSRISALTDEWRTRMLDIESIARRLGTDREGAVAVGILGDAAGLGESGQRDIYDLLEQASSKAGDLAEQTAAGRADPRLVEAFAALGVDPGQLAASQGIGAIDLLIRQFAAGPGYAGQRDDLEQNIGEVLGGGDIDVLYRLADVYTSQGDDVLARIDATLRGAADRDYGVLADEAYESRILRGLTDAARDIQLGDRGNQITRGIAALGQHFEPGHIAREEVFGGGGLLDELPAGYRLPGVAVEVTVDDRAFDRGVAATTSRRGLSSWDDAVPRSR